MLNLTIDKGKLIIPRQSNSEDYIELKFDHGIVQRCIL